MRKSQLVLAVIALVALTFSSIEALPCRFCSQTSCRAACISELQYCYDYKRSHKTKDACLTYYYICGISCAVVPRGIVSGPTDENDPTTVPTDEVPSWAPSPSDDVPSMAPAPVDDAPSVTPAPVDDAPSVGPIDVVPAPTQPPVNSTEAPSVSI